MSSRSAWTTPIALSLRPPAPQPPTPHGHCNTQPYYCCRAGQDQVDHAAQQVAAPENSFDDHSDAVRVRGLDEHHAVEGAPQNEGPEDHKDRPAKQPDEDFFQLLVTIPRHTKTVAGVRAWPLAPPRPRLSVEHRG